jgi:two-component system, OmpR family, sensor kinase
MHTPIHQRLYLRIWLAVVATIAVVAGVAGWLGSQEAERERASRPVREITIRNAEGEVLGQATARPNLSSGRSADFQVTMKDGSTLIVQFTRTPRPADGDAGPGGPRMGGPGGMGAPGFGGPGMGPRDRSGPPGQPPQRLPFSFFWLMVILSVAVALVAYPIVRRITRRLETVQSGVQRWGAGELSLRLPEDGHDEVAYLARQFNQSAQQIEALLEQQKSLLQSQKKLLDSQKSLLANASHELRSPLTRIRMGLELLADTPPESRASLQAEVSRSIAELDQLIDEILLASRLEAQEADLGTEEPVDLLALAAEEAVRVNAEVAVGPGPDADRPTELVVAGIPKLLRRALRNLLENARRYARSEVSLLLQREGTHLLLQVRDDGPGVPEAYRSRVFEAFFRLPGASERDGGVGLGLALVKSIAERHGGSVCCVARADGLEGAVFEMRLPAA